jgi:hypothetical protein
MIGAVASLVPASCATPPGAAPPIDFDAQTGPDGTLSSEGGSSTTDSGRDGGGGGNSDATDLDSTLVDLDGEADAGPLPRDAAGDHDASHEGGDASHDAEAS